MNFELCSIVDEISLLDIKSLNKYDSQKMYAIYDRWPDIAKNAYHSNIEPISFKNVKMRFNQVPLRYSVII